MDINMKTEIIDWCKSADDVDGKHDGRIHSHHGTRSQYCHHWNQVSFNSRLGLAIFPTTASRTALGPTQPPIQWVPGALSLEVKRQGREADHSPPSSAEVNEWSYTSTPPIRLVAWCSVKAQETRFRYRVPKNSNSKVQRPSWEADSRSAGQGTRNFFTAFTEACHRLRARLIQH
jgi:hypothetical protein